MLSNGIYISDETLRVIGEFTINWSVFEATYCNNEASVGKIRRLDIQPANDKQAYLLMVNQALSKLRFTSYRTNRPLTCLSYSDRDLYHFQEKNVSPKIVEKPFLLHETEKTFYRLSY